MSYELGMRALKLQNPERLGHTEYCSNPALVRAVTGLDPNTDSSAWTKFYEAWQIDFMWNTHDGPIGFSKGRYTDMGHAVFQEGGTDWRDTVHCPFNSVEEVLEFDAVKEYGLMPLDELTEFYEKLLQGQKGSPYIYTAGYYNTIVSGAIQIFGWEMLLAAAADQERFEKVLDSIYEITLHHYKAWVKTSKIDAFICHDDMVWSQGAFMHPDFYRKAIFPRYKKLWKVMHDANIPVLFCSDGDFTEFIDDIIEAGADGLIFEPMTSLDYVVEKYGKTKAIFGSKVDCRTLTFGTKEQIKHQVDETLKLAKGCPGFFAAVGNHIPSNVPVDNCLYYFDYLSKNWLR